MHKSNHSKLMKKNNFIKLIEQKMISEDIYLIIKWQEKREKDKT